MHVQNLMSKWIDEFSFRFAQCETSWMGETWMLKSPRTWHNSLLERLYWLVWIMCLSVSEVIWQLSYVTKLCGTKAQVGKLVFTIAPYTLPRDAWDNQLDPFQPPPGAPHPRKKLTPPLLHTKPGINSPSFTSSKNRTKLVSIDLDPASLSTPFLTLLLLFLPLESKTLRPSQSYI